ncbi:MAG: hypothetical protein MUC42_12560 [Bryobacter sp.]|jgi:hypothetical protein|nr:hypothetical protein [Bryobacter sp.]
MKLLAVPLAAVLLTGCIDVVHLRPAITTPAPGEVLGAWKSAEDEMTIEVRAKAEGSVAVTATEKGESKRYNARVLKTGSTYVFEATAPSEITVEAPLMAVYVWIACEAKDANTMTCRCLNDKWIARQIAARPDLGFVRGTGSDELHILTASPEVLRALLETALRDPEAWEEPSLFRRAPGL